MNRAALEHIIRAAAVISGDDDIIVVGSQAILGSLPDAPAAMLVSDEADVYPRNFPERADLIDGSIGELSPFHDTFGYYAQGVAPGTAILPDGWEARLVEVRNANTRGAAGWCAERHDLVASKLVAGREKDVAFFEAAVGAGLLDLDVLIGRLGSCPCDPRVRQLAIERVWARRGG
jgi:hypothetical protein